MVKSYQEQLNDLYDQLKNKEISLEEFYDLCFEIDEEMSLLVKTIENHDYENN
jgi:hypothetical protein